MKKGRKKNNRIGYMPIEGETFETNGGGGGMAPVQDYAEPVYQEPELTMNAIDPIAEPSAYDMPPDVAVTLNQPTADTPPPAQLQTALSETPVLTEQPAPGTVNWKLIIAVVVIGYLLIRKAK